MKILIALAFIVSACATRYSIPESVEEKMARFEDKSQKTNVVPEFHVFSYNFKTGRAPASVKQSDTPTNSNKRLYFLSLYSQYDQLKKFAKGPTPQLNICPSFNTGLVKYNEITRPNNYKSKLQILFSSDSSMWNREYLALYPELSLPISDESKYPTVADILKKGSANQLEILQQAIDLHILKTYRELAQLCETGTSNNYYIFENMVTYINTQKSFRGSSHNLKILMKSPVFANVPLLHSLSQTPGNYRRIASIGAQNLFLDELLDRLNISWVHTYYQELDQRRK